MSEFIMPEFLKKDYSKIGLPESARLMDEYYEKFNKLFTTEGLIMDEEEFSAILRICLKENKTFEEVTGTSCDYDNNDI